MTEQLDLEYLTRTYSRMYEAMNAAQAINDYEWVGEESNRLNRFLQDLEQAGILQQFIGFYYEEVVQ